MIVKMDAAALTRTRWHEYAARFVFGGLVTVIAGAIAQKWGPAVGGLFLAFPAIFPASATLVEKHERERKTRQGMQGRRRGRDAAADDAMGAAIGSLALLFFGAVSWWFLPRGAPGLVLASATFGWLIVAVSLWIFRKTRRRRPRRYHVT
jgi:hypothetical protein